MVAAPDIIGYDDYSVDKIGFIRQALAGYVGGTAIIAEMVQNADDAGARSISFQFRSDALVVRNSSTFTERDFKNLLSIASGGKREEVGKVGTWGTGFLAVFHVTDAPELLSAGRHYVIEPHQNSLARRSSSVEGTEFRLPWRHQASPLGKQLDAGIWGDEEIKRLKDSVAEAIYRLVIFLRNVRVIEVYEGDDMARPLYKIERKLVNTHQERNFKRERYFINYQRVGTATRSDEWLYYSANVQRPQTTEIVIKDLAVTIAFPLDGRESLASAVPPKLYNFLPTPINTGFGFQINGAFFPDNNRRSILIDPVTQAAKTEWNRRLIGGLSQLLIESLLDIRDQVADTRRFYDLLPSSHPSHPVLELIHERFVSEAAKMEIVRSSLGTWIRPGQIYVGTPGLRLHELAANYMPVLPPGAPQNFRELLTKTMGAPWLGWVAIVEFLRPSLRPGVELAKAHPMINNRDKLRLFYNALPGTPTTEQGNVLRTLPLALAQDNTLRSFAAVWRADAETRSLIGAMGPLLLDAEVQESFPAVASSLVSELRGAELVDWLAATKLPVGPVSPAKAPRLFGDPESLKRLLNLIFADLHRVSSDQLAQLPLVRAESGNLCSGLDPIYQHSDGRDRHALAPFGLEFVDPEWSQEQVFAAVYRRAGVHDLAPRHVIAAFVADPPTPSLAQLIEILSYFGRNQSRIEPEDALRLRSLPLCLTQGERLVTVAEEKHLYLPPTQGQIDKRLRQHLDKLQLDNLVHSSLLTNETMRVLKGTLGLQAQEQTALLRLIVDNYHDQRLDDNARLDLLDYLNIQFRQLDIAAQRDISAILLAAPLLRCHDGIYRPATEVYFASPALDTIFSGAYNRLHSCYQLSTASPDDHDQEPYTASPWHYLFKHLGVNSNPTTADLVAAVEGIVAAGPPNDERIESIRRIYLQLPALLKRRSASTDPHLQRLATIAWLPASNDLSHWFKPNLIHRATLADLIGDQAPLLALGEPEVAVRELLNMPVYPTFEVVLAHLRAWRELGKSISARVYEFLNRTAAPAQIAALKTEEIIADSSSGRYWRPDRVFLGDYQDQYGKRRCYLNPPGGEAQQFLEKLGVRHEPHQLDDALAIIREIAADYKNTEVPQHTDLVLLGRNFAALGRQIGSKELQSRLLALRGQAIVPGENGGFHRPDRIALSDNEYLLNHFDQKLVPIVNKAASGNDDALGFIEKLGVPRLSRIVERRAVGSEMHVADAALSAGIRDRVPFLRRILRDLQDSADTGRVELMEQLKSINLYSCSKLTVKYSIKHADWTVEGYSNQEDALYEAKSNRLLIVQEKNGKIPPRSVARELERMLFPGKKQLMLIEQLLKMPLAGIPGLLDEYDFSRLAEDDDLELDDASIEQIAMATLGIQQPELPLTTATEPFSFWADDEDVLLDGPEATEILPAPTELLPSSTAGDNTAAELATPHKRMEQAPTNSAEPATEPQQVAAKAASPTSAGRSGDNDAVRDAGTGEAIPVFTGMLRPVVPVRINNYGKLHEKYGLPFEPVSVAPVEEMESNSPAGEDENAVPPTRARITLNYVQRYEGFLPLTAALEHMLRGKPRRLECLTDYSEWQGELFVDQRLKIVHNREWLTALFDAHNIPAGGIVYVEERGPDAVYLYWRQGSSVAKVKGWDMGADGAVEQFEIAAMEVPCEVDEYILRAEKRLENPAALFMQALDKGGIFEVICNVFGAPGREMGYKEIFAGVCAVRPVANASIRMQLVQRPCFVQLGGDTWRFQPELGAVWAAGDHTLDKPSNNTTDRSGGIGSFNEANVGASSSSRHSVAPANRSVSIWLDLLTELKTALITWEQRPPQAQNQQASGLRELAEFLLQGSRRVQMLAAELDRPAAATSTDELLQLWNNLADSPADGKARQALEQRLWHIARDADAATLHQQLERLTLITPTNLCQQTFYPLIERLARRAGTEKAALLAELLYKLLQEAGAGDFSRQIAQFATQEELHEYLAAAQKAQDAEKWEWLREAWVHSPGHPAARAAVQAAIKEEIPDLLAKIASSLKEQNLHGALDVYSAWIAQVDGVGDAWQNDECAAKIWLLARQLFEIVVRSANRSSSRTAYFRRALGLLAPLPTGACATLSTANLLQVVRTVADDLREGGNALAAAALVEYSLWLINAAGLPAPAKELKFVMLVLAGDLHEQSGLYKQAHTRLLAAGKATTDVGEINRLMHRRHNLGVSMDEQKAKGIEQDWRQHAAMLLDSPEFLKLVNEGEFRRMLD